MRPTARITSLAVAAIPPDARGPDRPVRFDWTLGRVIGPHGMVRLSDAPSSVEGEVAMRVLDLDMDYFLDCPVYFPSDHDLGVRPTNEKYVNSVWPENRVRTFLEQNLGLSRARRIPGRVVVKHNESLLRWEELVDEGRLDTPFSVVHVDSHADLGLGVNNAAIWDVLHRDVRLRAPKYCKRIDVDGRFFNIDQGNYLLYAIAARWIDELVYCANPNGDHYDIPDQPNGLGDPPLVEISKGLKEKAEMGLSCDGKIRLNASLDGTEQMGREPVVGFRIVPTVEEVRFNGGFDYVVLAQSPAYTPENADFIMDVFREYIEDDE